jgi:glycerol-3-phosphate cytidylyltransferase
MPKKEKLLVYTGGTFDLFHSGHANLLRNCAKIGNVVVSLNTDEFIFDYKKKNPVMSFSERRAVLESCKYVDLVIPNFGGADSKVSIEIANPDVIAIGSDWARKDYYSQMGFDQDWLDQRGISLIYIPYTRGVSSTEIKTRIANGNSDFSG